MVAEKDYSSDSDAPEEVTQATAKALAVEELTKQRAAKQNVKEKSKAKRRAEIQRNIGQKKAKSDKIIDELNEIPADLLKTVAALKRGDIKIREEKDDDGVKKQKVFTRKETIVDNDLETEATNFKVIKFDEIEQPIQDQSNDLESIQNFKNVHFFRNRAIKRSKAWQVTCHKQKRRF